MMGIMKEVFAIQYSALSRSSLGCLTGVRLRPFHRVSESCSSQPFALTELFNSSGISLVQIAPSCRKSKRSAQDHQQHHQRATRSDLHLRHRNFSDVKLVKTYIARIHWIDRRTSNTSAISSASRSFRIAVSPRLGVVILG